MKVTQNYSARTFTIRKDGRKCYANVIEDKLNYRDAFDLLFQFEKSVKPEGIFIPNFYEIITL